MCVGLINTFAVKTVYEHKAHDERVINMNTKKLPFLQSQILEYLYLKISDKTVPTIDELSGLTGYPKDSKILLNAIQLLISW